MKLCRKCGKTKSFECFSINNRNPDKLQHYCKTCTIDRPLNLVRKLVRLAKKIDSLTNYTITFCRED